MHLVVGKGGVGKSTVAAASAVACADAGEQVLAVSLDQAHSLGDVLRSGDVGPGGFRGSIEVCELDTVALAAERWRALMGAAGAAGLGLRFGGGELFPEEITVLPGVQEMLGLAAVADRVDQDRWDRVIVDCPPTGETLRMLEIPGAASAYLERVWPRHRRLGVPSASGGSLVAVGVAEQVEAVSRRIAGLLEDAQRTAVTLVATPGTVVLAEARRALTAVRLLGLPLGCVVLNRCTARDGADAESDFTGAPVTRLPHLAEEPVGVEKLRPLAAALAGHSGREIAAPEPFGAGRESNAAQRGAAFRVVRESGSGLDAVYAWEIPLPLADPEAITLGRVGDDLIVGAAGVRRRMRLAPVLRRCHVLDAVMAAGALRVRFIPDPEVWPQ